MLRLSSLALAVTALLALPAAGQAADPLLSGYGGPGGGQQVLLGGHLLGGRGGGSGGSGGGGGTASLRAPAPAPVTAAPATAGTTGAATVAPAGGSAPAQHARGTHRHRGARDRKDASAKQPTAAPRRIAYPTRMDDAGGFPLSAGEVLAGLLILLAAAGMGAWMRRTAGRDGGGPQAAS